jgi:hypothetical protein
MRSESEEKHTAEAARFSEAELSAVLDRALERQRESDARQQEFAARPTTLEDALEIARSLNLPEEHVRAAAEEIVRRRHRDGRIPLVKARRKKQAIVAPVALGVLGLLFGVGSSAGTLGMALLGLLVLPVGYLWWCWLAAPVAEAEADRTEPLPVAGTCRVCGEPAVTPRSTFCEAHRYKGPG